MRYKYGKIGARISNKDATTIARVINAYKEAASAAAVIPIHALDASIMTKVAKGYGVLEIHDAMVMGLANAEELAKKYNEEFFKTSLSWNYAETIYNKLKETLSDPANKDAIEEVYRNDNDLDNGKLSKQLPGVISMLEQTMLDTKAFRKQLLKSEVTVEQMPLTKDSAYIYDGKQKAVQDAPKFLDRKYLQTEVETAVEEQQVASAETNGLS